MAHRLGLLKHKEVLSVQSISPSLFFQVKTLQTLCPLRPTKKVQFTNHIELVKHFFLGSQGLSNSKNGPTSSILTRGKWSIAQNFPSLSGIQKKNPEGLRGQESLPNFKILSFLGKYLSAYSNLKWVRNCCTTRRKVFTKLF